MSSCSHLLFVPLNGRPILRRPRPLYSSSSTLRCSASLNDPPEKVSIPKNTSAIHHANNNKKKATLRASQHHSTTASTTSTQGEGETEEKEEEDVISRSLHTNMSGTTDREEELAPDPKNAEQLSPALVGASIGALAILGTIGWAINNPEVTTEGMLHVLEEFMSGPRFFVSIGMGLSAFIQALTGFGFAVISVGAMTQLEWVVNSSVFEVVQPLAASLGALTGWALLLPEIKKVKWMELSTILIASTIATPFGVLLLDFVDAKIILKLLGALITGYVAYSVAGIEVPKKTFGGKAGAWVLGLLAGGLGGAFDITGPPLVIHGEAAQWDQTDGTFRRNVLAVVSINSTIVVLYDLCVGRLADYYYLDFVKYAMPAVVVGVVAGNYLSKRLDPAAFKKIVLATCMGLGAKLLLT